MTAVIIERLCAGQIINKIQLKIRTEKMARTNPLSRTRDYVLVGVESANFNCLLVKIVGKKKVDAPGETERTKVVCCP